MYAVSNGVGFWFRCSSANFRERSGNSPCYLGIGVKAISGKKEARHYNLAASAAQIKQDWQRGHVPLG